MARRALLRASWQPRMLPIFFGKRIVALSPHPDDETIGAGGFLWAHRRHCSIQCVVLSKGERGGAVEGAHADRAEYTMRLAQQRKDECFQVTRLLGAKEPLFFDFDDGAIPCSEPAVERLRVSMERLQPDIVLLPWFLDDQPDHRRANLLYAWACAGLDVLVLGYEVWSMLEPNAFFDITDTIEDKVALLRVYQTQLATVDYATYVRALASGRGYQYSARPKRCGSLEAFVSLPNREYCHLVTNLYGVPDAVTPAGLALLNSVPAKKD